MPHRREQWPSLPFGEWKDTYATLHRWTQIVGKIRLKQTPWTNHSWHVTLYPTGRGLTTLAMRHGARTFHVDFDFIDHRLAIQSSDGGQESIALTSRSVASFYGELMRKLAQLGLPVHIYRKPSELEDTLSFDDDETHATYDPEYVRRWWQIVAQSTCVLNKFRARFVGKSSPVHFFWGSFDLAVTRFSGRRAPSHPGGVPNLPDWITREAYSHEVSSCGFWPGGGVTPYPLFYAYAYPEPVGYRSAPIRPAQGTYHDGLREFVLPYDAMRSDRSPDSVLDDFVQSTYEAAADLGHWDRATLERTDREPIKEVAVTEI